jgi:hypothetical protein
MNILIGLALTMHIENRDPEPCSFCEVVPFSENSKSDYNSLHPHIRIEEGHFIAGAYLNNEGSKVSNETGYFEYGLVTGYNIDESILPFARLGLKLDESSSIFVAPSLYKDGKYSSVKTGTVIGLEIMY